jgi:prolyl-tRNA editing enzyme YbaK/EbsC (Cys-tRNA(Pro) deacylase)
MLQDFITTNKIVAEIISFKKNTGIQSVIIEKKLSSTIAAKCEFFLNEKEDELLLIHSSNSIVSIEKVKKITGAMELFEKNEEIIFDATGYKKEFLPPIGIYGVKVYLDKQLMDKKFLLFRIGDKNFLKITPDEILSSNDESFIDEIAIQK